LYKINFKLLLKFIKNMAAKKGIWISYDLGLKGDYTGLYTWLDTVQAKECGDSFAFFQIEDDGDLKQIIKKEIENNVSLNKSDRIYIIYPDEETGKTKGSFIYGGMKRASLEGYSIGSTNIKEDSV